MHAVLQLREGAPGVVSDAWIAHCRDRIAAYKVPKSVEVVERLPRSDAGKLNRASLAAARKEAAEGES